MSVDIRRLGGDDHDTMRALIRVPADYGDDPAVARCGKLGLPGAVVRFDIAPRATR